MRGLRTWLPVTAAVFLLLAEPAPGQTVFSASDASGEPGSFVTVTVTIDTTDAAQGWSFGLCHDDANLSLLDATAGATTMTVNGGGAPGFLSIETMPMPGPGVTMGVVVDLLGMNMLPPGTGYEILLADYELVGMPDTDPIQSDVCFCDTLGTPPVATVIVVGGDSIVPDQVCGQVTIIPPPDYCIDPFTCTGGVTDANLSWDICSPFDYFLLHRDGELLGLLDPSEMSYLDAGLAPGTYHYAIIGVAFPDPIGTPTIVTAECDVDIIPVTITDISPTAGSFTGGTTVTITGTGFMAAPDTTVTFGGTTALDITVVDDNTLTCVTPSTTMLGPVDVFVGNSLGDDTVTDGFLYGFQRGEINGDRVVDIADPVFALQWLFSGPDAMTPQCMEAVDANDDGMLDIADPVYLLTYLFALTPEPPPPFETPGLDPTPDGIGCNPAP